MNVFQVAQQFKREWTPEAFCKCNFALDAEGKCVPVDSAKATRFCFRGKLSQITNAEFHSDYVDQIVGPPEAVAFEQKVYEKLSDRGLRGEIESINDNNPDGYKILMDVVDEIILEESAKVMPQTPTFTPYEEVVMSGELVAV